MTQREKLQKQVESNEAAIKELQDQNIRLVRQMMLLCDDTQRFEEKM